MINNNIQGFIVSLMLDFPLYQCSLSFKSFNKLSLMVGIPLFPEAYVNDN